MITLNGKEVLPTRFPDRTTQVWKLDNIYGVSRNVVTWWFEQEAELIHLAQLERLLPNNGVLYIPYLPYARQDKKANNQSTFALTVLAQFLNTMYWQQVYVFDPHSDEASNAIENMIAIPPDLSFVNKYKTVIFPDAGAAKRYKLAVLAAGFDGRIIIGNKVRDQATGYITSYEVDREPMGQCVVIDDLCDGGATFNILAKSLGIGRDRLTLYVSHGIFSNGLYQLKQNYHKVITTRSFYGGVSNEDVYFCLATSSNMYEREIKSFVEFQPIRGIDDVT